MQNKEYQEIGHALFKIYIMRVQNYLHIYYLNRYHYVHIGIW